MSYSGGKNLVVRKSRKSSSSSSSSSLSSNTMKNAARQVSLRQWYLAMPTVHSPSTSADPSSPRAVFAPPQTGQEIKSLIASALFAGRSRHRRLAGVQHPTSAPSTHSRQATKESGGCMAFSSALPHELFLALSCWGVDLPMHKSHLCAVPSCTSHKLAIADNSYTAASCQELTPVIRLYGCAPPLRFSLNNLFPLQGIYLYKSAPPHRAARRYTLRFVSHSQPSFVVLTKRGGNFVVNLLRRFTPPLSDSSLERLFQTFFASKNLCSNNARARVRNITRNMREVLNVTVNFRMAITGTTSYPLMTHTTRNRPTPRIDLEAHRLPPFTSICVFKHI